MVTFSPESLRNIKRFDQLVAYLRDELDWPIDTEDFDDLTFDYEPEELGIDPKNAAKIEIIKQLRPLVSNQPWGIFWIKFRPKRLPVVALRRILGQLVTKKRATTGKAGQPTWKLDDLMLISAIGEEDERQITFAHFADDAANGLPTLRVLGWDDDDTLRKLDWVERQLKSHLTWPDGGTPNEWRMQWRQAFILRHREVPKTTKELVAALAELAQAIRKRANTAIALETEHGPLRKLHTAFQDSLIHDLSHDGFADMYAQTIAYGLLSARISRPAGLVADDAALMVPRTNPFLRELMEEFLRIGGRQKDAPNGGIDFDELGVNDIVELLRKANMEAVITDFGRARPGEDPVIYFYEDFMKAYDAKQRVRRGIYYTPIPVVSFIVRSVDEILREEFGLPLGLADTTTWAEMANRFPPSPPGRGQGEGSSGITIPDGVSENDPFVQILDPAVGTGTFLVEVIDLIHNRMNEHWLAQGHMELELEKLWNEYVQDHLLPRLYGFELLMAPYAICHMKVGLKLAETGYRFRSSQRLRVYLTNSLEPPQDLSEMLEFVAPFLAHEARAASVVKESLRPTVVIGNPPYSCSSSNKHPWILSLIEDYKKNLNERKIYLDDDFIKFLRLAQHVIQVSGAGVVGMITNSTYLDGLTQREMRRQLLASFARLSITNLHGNQREGERSPDGSEDENVFDILQGVAITVAASLPGESSTHEVTYRDLWGLRVSKYECLLDASKKTSPDVTVTPSSPGWFFLPRDESGSEYEAWPSIPEMFPEGVTGVQTKRDALVFADSERELRDRIEVLLDESIPDSEIRTRYGVRDIGEWSLLEARQRLRNDANWNSRLEKCMYRPFDSRWLFYSGDFIARDRRQVLKHMLQPNLALVVTRQSNPSLAWSEILVVDQLVEKRALASYSGEARAYPLLLTTDLPMSSRGPVPNLSVAVSKYMRTIDGGQHDELGIARRFFDYLYAVAHSPTYRRRYDNQIKVDYVRLPLPATGVVMRDLAALGGELVALHVLQSPCLEESVAKYIGSSNPEVERVGYADGTVWLDKAQTCGFVAVAEEVWNFHIGGYQVCHKWLSDRKRKGGKNPRPGRVLTDEDIDHYQKIVVALSETIRIMAEIDEVIETHGGWPDAFITDPEHLNAQTANSV